VNSVLFFLIDNVNDTVINVLFRLIDQLLKYLGPIALKFE